MKRLLVTALAAFALSAAPLAAETVQGVLMDNMCMGKYKGKGFAAAQDHTKGCALMPNCKASGFAIIQEDGSVVKLDSKGNDLAVKAIEATSKEKDLQVKADGSVTDGTLAVSSLSLI